LRGLHDRLLDAAMRVVELEDGPDVVSVKFQDSDGYVAELCWESVTLV
jgi:hypothetical protein